MNEVGRRVFVGSVAAGLPMLAIGGVRLAGAQRQTGSAPVTDPVFAQIMADMKQSARALSREGSAEHVRRLSSSLRLLSAWGVSTQFDARVKNTMRAAIRRDGRAALIRREIDVRMFRAEAEALGFDRTAAVPLPVLPVVDLTTRQRAVDDMAANGVTGRWRALADMLDGLADVIDRRAAVAGRPVTLAAQTTPAGCAQVAQTLAYLNLQMVFWCGPWFLWAMEPCGVVSASYLGVYAAGWWAGC